MFFLLPGKVFREPPSRWERRRSVYRFDEQSSPLQLPQCPFFFQIER
jgi:hypothetical protein